PAGILRALTRGIWIWEWIGPFLLLAPATRPRVRCAGLAGFALMHLGFELLLGIGIFPFVDLVSLIPFVPPAAWDRTATARARLARRLPSPRARVAPLVDTLRRLPRARYGRTVA